MTAQDGHIYEKSAIEEFFKTKPGNIRVPSPMTQIPMGKTLLSAPKIKNHIESMVMKGYIQCPLADKWKKQHHTKKAVDVMLEKAQKKRRLSTIEMKSLGGWCQQGCSELGIKQDFEMALRMFETLHAMGDPEGTALLGNMFYRGLGTTPNAQKGLVYLGMARAKGSSLGAYYLAECFSHPRFGLPVDLSEACFCYKLSLRLMKREDTNSRGLSANEVATVRKRIAELMEQIPSTIPPPPPAALN